MNCWQGSSRPAPRGVPDADAQSALMSHRGGKFYGGEPSPRSEAVLFDPREDLRIDRSGRACQSLPTFLPKHFAGYQAFSLVSAVAAEG